MQNFFLPVLLILTFGTYGASGQTHIDTTLEGIQKLQMRYTEKVEGKVNSIDNALQQKTSHYVAKLSKLENRILSKLQKLSPSKAQNLAPSTYDKWMSQTGVGSNSFNGIAPNTYVAGLDTMKTTVSFLTRDTGSQPGSSLAGFSSANLEISKLQGDLNQSNALDLYIDQRRQQITQLLSQYSNLPPGIVSAFNEYKETAYYYRQQVQAYKDMLNDPDKIERVMAGVVQKVPAFQQFMSQNSILSSLFAAPPSGGSAAGNLIPNVGNLQTRIQVQQLIQQQMSAGGVAAQQSVQQQMQLAQNKLTSIQQQVAQYGSVGGDMDLPPGFKPNSQKIKPFLKRLEYGANVQFAKSNYNFPATANVGLTLGYKINDKSSVGVGLAYLAGMGTGWGHMQFSNQGIGLRSYMDWKVKKSYYVVGGYEVNYMTQFENVAALKDAAWQKSVLLGMERKYKISSKLQGNIQILFDVLYKEEIPQGQMIKFRVGYNF